MIFSPILVGVAEIEIAQRAADGDVADAERRRRENFRFLFEAIEHRRLAHGGARFVRVGRVRAQALGDGLLDMLVLLRDERLRANPSDVHQASAAVRKAAVLDSLDLESAALSTAPFGIGHIAIGCALSYLDFRYADEVWRKGHPRIAGWYATFAARPSVRATEPVDDA